MPRVDNDFRQRVFDLVASIPSGRIMTYGQIAAICGAAYAAWEVGQIAHFNRPDLPWQRVVNKSGGLARGYPGGMIQHRKQLENEGVTIKNDRVANMEALLWTPNQGH